MTYFKVLAYILVLVGAINWGLVGFFDFDLVAYIFGEKTTISKAIYSLVGLSALYNFYADLNTGPLDIDRSSL